MSGPSAGTRWIALILAAGKGTRMKSDLAKVLHEIDGRTLLGHVLELCRMLPLSRTVVVVGHQAEAVRARHLEYAPETVLQEPQRGTGHAVQVAAPLLASEPPEASLLVLYGDVPLLREATLRELMERHHLEGNDATVLTARVADPSGYGRVFRSSGGGFDRIVEERDLDPGRREMDEINSGIYAFELGPLLDVLPRLGTGNAQGEFYLTDALKILRDEGRRVGIFRLADPEEISGINDHDQLRAAASVLRRRRAGDGGCAVCRVLRERDDLLLDRRQGFRVMLAPQPYNSGHLWIVPERHVTSWASLEAEEAARIVELGAEAERWLEAAYQPAALNHGYNSGGEGEHLVFQVIPRWSGDSNFMPLIAGVNVLPESLEGSRRRILAVREGASQSGERDPNHA